MRIAAGILPYAFVNDKVYYLLGKDTSTNTWSDFGGKCEPVDSNNPVNCAVREFNEETLGVIVDPKTLKSLLHQSPRKVVSRKQYLVYYMYLVEVPYLPFLRSVFRRVSLHLSSRMFVEKCDILWADEQTLSTLALRPCFKSTLDERAHEIRDLVASSE